MSTIWGPYWEESDPKTGQYLLFRQPNPEAIKQSQAPLLKEPVSILLDELLKPMVINGTSSPIIGSRSKDTRNRSVINAAIAMMDEEIVRKVRAAGDSREALVILSLYDPRFGDGWDSEQWCVQLLTYFGWRPGGKVWRHSRGRKRPGPPSAKRAAIWDYLNEAQIGRSLRRSNSLRSRQRLALKIGSNLESQLPEEFFGAGSKPDSAIMAVLRRFSQQIVSSKKLTKKSRRARTFFGR